MKSARGRFDSAETLPVESAISGLVILETKDGSLMLSARHIGSIAQKYNKLRTKIETVKEKAEETMGQVLQSAEIAAAAGGFAYANARYGNMVGMNPTPEIDVMGVPADVGAAVALHGMAFAGALGKYKEHAHNLGDGALASYLVRVGLRLGNAKRSTPVAKVAGEFSDARPWQGNFYGQGSNVGAGVWRGVG